MKSIAICNQKGGVGKTAIAIHVGGALARQGKRVLLVDLDPQGHLTEGLGLTQAYDVEDENLAQLLLTPDNSTYSLDDLIIKRGDNLFVVPSNVDMFIAERRLVTARGRENRLQRLFNKFDSSRFDLCLIDCPPNLLPLTDNAFVAAKRALVPVQLQSTSERALELLVDQIASLRDQLGVPVSILGFVPNQVEDTNEAKETREALRKMTEGTSISLLTEIRKRTVLAEAWRVGKTIFEYRPSNDATDMFKHLAKDIVRRVNGHG